MRELLVGLAHHPAQVCAERLESVHHSSLDLPLTFHQLGRGNEGSGGRADGSQEGIDAPPSAADVARIFRGLVLCLDELLDFERSRTRRRTAGDLYQAIESFPVVDEQLHLFAELVKQPLGIRREVDVDQATFRSKRSRENNYLIDRQAQKTVNFTGIEGINTQDRAVQESMGRIVDRSKEHLGPADKAIIQARRLLLDAVKTVQAGGTPRGVDATYYTLRAAEGVILKLSS